MNQLGILSFLKRIMVLSSTVISNPSVPANFSVCSTTTKVFTSLIKSAGKFLLQFWFVPDRVKKIPADSKLCSATAKITPSSTTISSLFLFRVWLSPDRFSSCQMNPAVSRQIRPEKLISWCRCFNEGKAMAATKTASKVSRSSSNSLTANKVSKPIQPDWPRSRSQKTDSKYHCYCYCYCYLGYLGLCYLDCFMQSKDLNLKTFGSCFIHVLRNIGVDLFQSLASALTQTSYVLHKTWLALYVWFSRWYNDIALRFGKTGLTGENWWRYYNVCDCNMILKILCKVSDFLNRSHQYIQ